MSIMTDAHKDAMIVIISGFVSALGMSVFQVELENISTGNIALFGILLSLYDMVLY